MALKVMLSSVVRGLADVRDAVAPVIKILRYDVIRFETVVKTPVPPRATCVEMVENSDMYLLILGEEYGDPMPGTGLAPTEEEWTVARNLGKPTVVFKKSGMTPGPAQAAFIKKVEDYETGVWRHSFTDTADLISQLEGALATAAEALQPAAPTPLASPVSVPWLQSASGIFTGAGTVLETHALPVGGTAALPAATFGDLKRIISTVGQDDGIFEVGQAIDFTVSETAVIAQASRMADDRLPAFASAAIGLSASGRAFRPRCTSAPSSTRPSSRVVSPATFGSPTGSACSTAIEWPSRPGSRMSRCWGPRPSTAPA